MEMDVDMMMSERMPETGPSRDHTQSKMEWARFLSRCISSRLDPETFDNYITLLYSKHPLPPAIIADIFLRPQPANHESLDPRIPRYIHVLASRKLIDTPSVLKALYKYSTSHVQAQKTGHPLPEDPEDKAPLRWGSSYASEEVVFYRITKAVAIGTGIENAGDALQICKLIAKWMTLFTLASEAFNHEAMGLGQLHGGHLQSPQSRDEMEAARAAFVMLLLGICENQTVLSALSRPFAKNARRALSESLASFIPSIIQSASQIATRLELFRTETLASFEPADKNKDATNTVMDDLESSMALENFVVAELPNVNSRAGLYIYLNANLVGRPLLDDTALFNYLHNRYQGDIQSTTIDLILASFDILANAVFRNEGQQASHVLRSYLINKLPLLLATLATSMYPPLSAQFCITEALSQVDTNAFPTLSAMFDDTNNNNNTFTDSVRQDFCFACCLHDLIPESSIEGLLGEITYQTLPLAGRYVKGHLVEECVGDPERIPKLIGELDNMDGNVGAACQALAEVIGRLCHNKETMTLKLLCGQLAKKPLSLDVMLLFDKPITILHPLCELLDNWRYEEDQGEYQPVYEEFGSILLLVLAFVYRYNLSPMDLGIRSDSFVAKLLGVSQLNRPLSELTEQENRHLGRWIHGLFDTESGGLADELLSSCPPQDFYLLVPTLFHQIVLAFSTNYLDEESLKIGVEYFVNTFLLPSLVPAILYMSNQLWIELSNINHNAEHKAVLKILQLILLTKQGSTESQAMLASVVNIIAIPLEYGLRSYQRFDPKSPAIEPLLKAMRDNLRLSRRTASAPNNELEAWTQTANGGLTALIRHMIQGFVTWSAHPGLNVMPTSYTHRQILVALKMHGAKRFLYTILEEVKSHTEAGHGSIAHDVATALICAPDVTNMPPPGETALLMDSSNHPVVPPQLRISLRAALKAEAEDCKTIQKSDPVMAEIIVRLYRKVEAQMHVPPPTESMLQGELANLGLGENAAALGDALAAAAQNDGLQDEASMSLDLGGGSDMGHLGGDSGHGGLDFGSADDMFGGLTGGAGADLLDGWDMS
ncbi:Med5-domain-containing protein [Annulohypoxylon truncatum]|uniref:Med5-domain-containing protein n=1 Tax=Annulohypoxylon truncatum TaxID=327061 RepID=UPI0020082EC4|nr:Med5-domain-containing protein [Annulohypoxylon truncatum]KAI1214580.1 Med5-domain-containing protein [Annulohypoxylon truncatum]